MDHQPPSDSSHAADAPAKSPDDDDVLATVAVRALCEFTAKAGDLDLRFTPSPSAQDGMLGHKLVTGRRSAGYEREISLQGAHAGVIVRGRADGFDPHRLRLEEIKTYRGDLAAMRANHRALHWAQAKIYGWLLCQARGLDALTVALVYLDVATQRETVLQEQWPAAGLREHFESACERYAVWARSEREHRRMRDAALRALVFPHGEFRPGQRVLAESVYRAAGGRRLLAQAPTGIGKTVGTLFPMLKAMPAQALDKVFYLAAKTPGRRLALDALERIAPPGCVPLRVVELVARDKACEHPDKACHGQSCPLARGFYDRLDPARASAAARARLDRDALRAVALAHGICPYYLSQEMTRWADAVVGDYNYFFDTSAMLHAMTVAGNWRVGVLVDEAHNLVDRARGMYSGSLDRAALKAAKKVAAKGVRTGARMGAAPALRQALERLDRRWSQWLREAPQSTPCQPHEDMPGYFVQALQQAAMAAAEDAVADEAPATHEPLLLDPQGPGPHPPEPRRQEFLFDLLHFAQLAESFGDHSLLDTTGREGAITDLTINIRNVVPAGFVRPRMAAAQALVLFSATLHPADYHVDMLGLPADTVALDVPSPFSAGQLRVSVARHISTRWPDRARSLDAIVQTLGTQWRGQPGNYLAFVSSYGYLEDLVRRFAGAHPDIPLWQQSRGMAEAEREAFLARFEPGGQGMAFAVLGGPFAEGIDLPGDRLIGAFIATLGLPQVNAVNERMRERLQERFGAGYEYAYLYPGLQKVVQAAGRVIRTLHDEGVVHLMDDRFARPQVRALLPSWWRVSVGSQTAAERPPPDVSEALSYTRTAA